MSISEATLEFGRQLRARQPWLIVAHRGTRDGVIAENTAASAMIALASGADIVEIDATASTDGVAYAHHDGTEPVNLIADRNLAHASSAEIDAMRFPATMLNGQPMGVARLTDVVATVRDRDAMIHIDRAWQWWGPTLEALDSLDMPERIVLKTWAGEAWLTTLAEHPVPYPVILITRTWADVERGLATPGLNLAGLEFIAASTDDELGGADAFRRAHDLGLQVLINAENLDTPVPLFAGFDDHTSVLGDPDQGWGKLVDLGADQIQTDFPWLLDDYRQKRVSDA